MIIIVLGVSGCGKTTIGKLLSESMDLPFYDADDFHPEANVQKMANGDPLNDKDRQPWLQSLAEFIAQWEKQGGAILACSALKESYRELLKAGGCDMRWVYLSGTFDQIKFRMDKRRNHYMKTEMLQSQFDTLEVPVYGYHVDISSTPEDIVQDIITQLKRRV